MVQLQRIGIVGASLAGLRCAEALRRRGFDGDLVVVGDEPHLPYNRPPLSKDYLTSAMSVADVELPGVRDIDVEWRLSTRATGLGRAGRRIDTDRGPVPDLDAVVIATGARARRIPAPDLAGIHVLRDVADAAALREDLSRHGPVAVVGAGLIGCEIASSCVALGAEVTVVDPAPAIMSRPLPPAVSDHLHRMHVEAGVRFRLGASVTGFAGGDRVRSLTLSDGSVVPAGTVVLAVGSAANTGWLGAGSGLDLDDGVRTDADCRAEGGGGVVFAVGDVCRKPDEAGRLERCEHWAGANEHAALATWALLDGDPATRPVHVPFFWSDQYGRRLQVIGRPWDGPDVEVETGGKGGVIFRFGSGGELRGAAAIDLPGKFAAARRELTRAAARTPEVNRS